MAHDSYSNGHPGYRPLTVDVHLRLIPPSLDHAPESLLWVQSPEVVQFMGADFPEPSLSKEEQRIRDILANVDEYSWMIELDGEVIGNVCINSIKETSEKCKVRAGNLTILIGSKNRWGQGLGTKVCAAVLDWAFNEAGFRSMTARALQENIASIKTLQKLGFYETGVEAYEGLVNGKATEWRNFQKNILH